MHLTDIFQITAFLLLVVLLTKPLGLYMFYSIEGRFSKGFAGKTENMIYKMSGIKSDDGMNWKTYLFALLIFNALGFSFVFLLQLIQNYLPLNPRHLPNVGPSLAFNTAVSFMTNTNWQSYAGETTLSYAVQMIGLTGQNFLSAATGIAVFLALTRGIKNKTAENIGNFWVDLTRTTIYILVPLSFILALLLVSQGVIQNFNPYHSLTTLEGGKQIIPSGPAASQIAIKQIGTNGGGFFNANSAFPYENPTPFSNFLELISILLVPASLTYTYGKMTGSTRQGWVLFSVMMILFLAGLLISLSSEYSFNAITGFAGNPEGKETRIGTTGSVLWSTATTAASNGSVNAVHESLMPLSAMVAMLNIMLGEIIFGGVGAGMYGMLIFVILTVFIAGLMIGRTPEYLGKKIQAKEIQMAILAIIAPSLVILVFTAVALLLPQGISSIYEKGPHGFSEVLYAFTSAAGNNGSAFAGLNANTAFYNIILGIGMLIGRFAVIIPVMVIAGSLAKKKITPESQGTFKTDTALFAFLLISIILIVGALTFLPALSLGPIAEQMMSVMR